MSKADEEWERIVEEANNDSQRANKKTILGFSQREIWGGLGALLGAIAGPCLLVLSLFVAEWIYPTKEEYGLFWAVILLLISIPVGALAGFKIVQKITDGRRR